MNRNINERKDVQKKFDEASSTVTYIGEATIGAGDSDAKWRIKKITVVSATETKITWANSNADYDKTWTDRASYTYL